MNMFIFSPHRFKLQAALIAIAAAIVFEIGAEGNQVLLPQISPSVQQPNRNISEEFVFINATPVLLNIQFYTPAGVLITQPVQPSTSYTVRKKSASVVVYAREGGKPTPITPDMIINGSVSIKFDVQASQQPQPISVTALPLTQEANPSMTVSATQSSNILPAGALMPLVVNK